MYQGILEAALIPKYDSKYVIHSQTKNFKRKRIWTSGNYQKFFLSPFERFLFFIVI